MQLAQLLDQSELPKVEVAGLCNDSRRIDKGDCFFAYQGQATNGNNYILDAIEKGAVAVCSDTPQTSSLPVPYIHIPKLQQKQSSLAARFFGHPSRNLHCIGVTGTNGKTSVAYGLAGLLPRTGFAGSLGWGTLPKLCKTNLTTVDAISVQAGLAEFHRQRFHSVAMEVSSHALDQARVADVRFEVAIFTNLTQDHLDYHGSMEAYGECKARLFRFPQLGVGIVNVDDLFGLELVQILKQRSTPCITYGRTQQAMVSWSDVTVTPDGLRGVWYTPQGKLEFVLPIMGEYQIANAAAMLACAEYYEHDLQELVGQMSLLPSPPGRMELLRHPSGVRAVIDFAHTPDALLNVLKSLKGSVEGRLICVFGCGGDRDPTKRVPMAKIAEQHADFSIVTTDNPRFEDPEQIVSEITEGFEHKSRFVVEVDRATAIKTALEQARPNDLIVIAGKGSEQFQEVQGQRIPFNDKSSFLHGT